jgi:site-specific DNA-methyltransferase (adenine-specific)
MAHRSRFSRPIKPTPDELPPKRGRVAAPLLRSLEDVLERGFLDTYVDVGEALAAIRDQKLYRASGGYTTFEEYLDKRWRITRQTGYDYIHAAAVARNVKLSVQNALPLSHAVALYALPVELQIELARRFLAEGTPLPLWRQLIADLQRQRRNGNGHVNDEGGPDPVLPPDVDVRVGDAAEPPPEWTDQVDLQITSPPYCLGIREADYVDFDDYDAYLGMLPTWSAAMYRVAAPWARIALVVPIDISRPRKAPVAADWIAAMQAAGWRYETAIVWEENNISRSVARGSIDSATSPKVICPAELIPIFCKGIWDLAPVRQALRPDWGESDLSRSEWLEWTFGLWRFPGEKSANVGGHPAAFPEELPSRLIRLLSFPGAVVGDLFLGSGTTAVAAAQLGRHFVGGDISERWVNYARDRVARRANA